MKPEELVPGKWYYCEQNKDGCKYFLFLKHNYTSLINNYNTDSFLIQGIDRKKYDGFYIDDDIYREMTPEEKLKLL